MDKVYRFPPIHFVIRSDDGTNASWCYSGQIRMHCAGNHSECVWLKDINPTLANPQQDMRTHTNTNAKYVENADKYMATFHVYQYVVLVMERGTRCSGGCNGTFCI